MKTQTIPIGLVFKQIAKEKRLSAEVIGKRLGMTRQNVNYLFNNKTQANILELQQWASALETSPETIETQWSGKKTNDVEQNFPDDLSNKIDRIFQEWKDEVRLLKEQLNKKDEQIAAKDEQISRLFDLLGKLKGICLRPFGQFSTFFFAVN